MSSTHQTETRPSSNDRPRVSQQPATGRTVVVEQEATGLTGWVMFVAVSMVVLGAFHIIEGILALSREAFYVVGQQGLVITWNFDIWGWIQIVGGVAVAAAGVLLFTRKAWARMVAVIVLAVSIVVSALFLPAFPVWGALMMGLGLVALWAVTAHGREIDSA